MARLFQNSAICGPSDNRHSPCTSDRRALALLNGCNSTPATTFCTFDPHGRRNVGAD
jgi:hypothetical protein